MEKVSKDELLGILRGYEKEIEKMGNEIAEYKKKSIDEIKADHEGKVDLNTKLLLENSDLKKKIEVLQSGASSQVLFYYHYCMSNIQYCYFYSFIATF